jgi:hypothetical protein
MKVSFDHAVSGIAPGQSAVFYEGNDLLGGGFLFKLKVKVVVNVECRIDTAALQDALLL